MRLISVHTKELEEFFGTSIPPYAIISHTWSENEVTFDDMKDPRGANAKSGYAKIRSTCQEAIPDKLEYAWVDTCCIDEKSSAELSEAINSMWVWYSASEGVSTTLDDRHVFVIPVDIQMQSDGMASAGHT